eukprot:1161220-Pelagomonas_calceolata.AAC.18
MRHSGTHTMTGPHMNCHLMWASCHQPVMQPRLLACSHCKPCLTCAIACVVPLTVACALLANPAENWRYSRASTPAPANPAASSVVSVVNLGLDPFDLASAFWVRLYALSCLPAALPLTLASVLLEVPVEVCVCVLLTPVLSSLTALLGRHLLLLLLQGPELLVGLSIKGLCVLTKGASPPLPAITSCFIRPDDDI